MKPWTLTLELGELFAVKFRSFFAQLKISDNSFHFWLINDGGEPPIHVLKGFSVRSGQSELLT